METSLIRLVEKALPAQAGTGLTYNANHNIFLTTGYTSASLPKKQQAWKIKK